ncbi:MAG: peptidoglycan synthetase [Mucilaginibacter polytrichastri]|nr:peptidoglycan synthetase [Mucilaginibacter polytrichastri]
MRIHFIAIGGSAMHNLAIALHKNGHEVSGSDDVFYEPSAGRLKKYGLLPEKAGWFPEKITGETGSVILGMHAKADNPELLEAQRLGIRIYSYPEYIYEQSRKKTRVVIGGSHGKTTITAMIMHVLRVRDRAFDYLVGAMLDGFETMVQLSDAPLILIEGDEYLASPIDRRPKFHLYKAHLAVLSGIAWDHINVFPTFDNYKLQFRLFLESMEKDGKVGYAPDDQDLAGVIADDHSALEKIMYSAPEHTIENGVTYILNGEERIPLRVFGRHNLTNIGAARQICLWLGINETDFYHAISSFKGAARRLELLGKNEHVFIYKDFAHSPSKLKATLNAARLQFPDKKLIACMELHTFSSLNENFLSQYAGTMAEADEALVFIDQKTFAQKGMEPFSEEKVKSTFQKNDLTFLTNPADFENFLREISENDYILLLMSSGNFGGINMDDVTAHLLTKNH